MDSTTREAIELAARRRRRKLALRLLVSALLVAALVAFVPWSTLKRSLARVSPAFFLLLVAGLLAAHVLGTFKWRMVVGVAGARLRRRDAFECYAAGLFSNIFLPSIVGGDVLRALLAGRRSGRMEAAVLGGAADRLIDIAALGALALGGALLVGMKNDGAWNTLLTLAAVFGVIAVLAAVPMVLRTPLKRWPNKLRRRVAQVLIALRRQRRQPGAALLSFFGALGMQGSLVGLNALIGQRLGLEAGAAAWCFAWALAKIAGLLPVSFNGIGVRDAAFAALMSPLVTTAALALAERKAIALASSLVWQGVLIAGSLTAGAVWWWLKRASSPSSSRTPQTVAQNRLTLPAS